MPLIQLKVSVPVSDHVRDDLLAKASTALAQATGKPEAYIMVTLESCAARMAGTSEPAAFADVRGIGGLSRDVNAAISKAISDLFGEILAIEDDRIYLTFTDVAATNWGWRGATFG
jgi:phenylpyruvate tautomerase